MKRRSGFSRCVSVSAHSGLAPRNRSYARQLREQNAPYFTLYYATELYTVTRLRAGAHSLLTRTSSHSLSELATLAFACTHDLAHTTRAGPSFRNRRLGGPSAAPKAGREAALVGAQRSARRSIGGNSSAPSAKERDTQSVRGFPIVFERGRVTSGSSLTITIYEDAMPSIRRDQRQKTVQSPHLPP